MSSDTNHEGHEEREGHEGYELQQRHGMRLASPLDAHAERTMTETIGCAIRVHRELGPGFLESIYRKAMCLELQAAGCRTNRNDRSASSTAMLRLPDNGWT